MDFLLCDQVHNFNVAFSEASKRGLIPFHIHRLRANVQVSKIALRQDAHRRATVNLQLERFLFDLQFAVDYQVAAS